MVLQQGETLIGYSVFETFEECYQYNEDACFIASDRDGAEEFLDWGDTPRDACRILPVSLSDIMRDYGCSGAEYAMRPQAFERFRKLADLNGERYHAEPYDGDDSLRVVQVEGVIRNDD
jgi:hypothetical protein